MTSLTDRKDKIEPIEIADSGFLFGQVLAATPAILGGTFERSVVFISAHDESGALGIIFNKELKNADSRQMLESMGIVLPKHFTTMPIYLGGPVNPQRGFILHSDDYVMPSTVKFAGGICLTSEKQILQDYVNGAGPKNLILAMGYCGWADKQLEQELIGSAWVNFPVNFDLVFRTNNDGKWQKAGSMNGIDLNKIAYVIGQA